MARGTVQVQEEELNSDTGLDKVEGLVVVEVVAVPVRLDAAQLVQPIY